MKKPKHTDRWERMAISRAKSNVGDSYTVSLADTASLLRREHRAVVRMVRELSKRDRVGQLVNQPGYTAACDDVLAKLKARGQ